MTDRPLTTSTAHEEGHSRPVLQHCTFAQPYIPEEEEPCKMPQEVPRRTVSEDKPQVAGETPATMKAGQKIGQKDDSTSIGRLA